MAGAVLRRYLGDNMMMRRNNLATAAAFALMVGALASPALADCDVGSEPFFMHKNDTTKHQITTDSKGCELNFLTDGKTKFRSATVLTRPTNGKLVKSAGLEFLYHPKPGFKGADAFSMKVCGSSPVGKGCSTLQYTTQVN